MNASQRLLQAAKARQGFESDYRLAKALELDLSRIYKYVNGRREIEDDGLVAKLADLAGLNPLEAVARFAADRARTPASRDVWTGIVQAVQGRGKKVVGRVGIELCSLALQIRHAVSAAFSSFARPAGALPTA